MRRSRARGLADGRTLAGAAALLAALAPPAAAQDDAPADALQAKLAALEQRVAELEGAAAKPPAAAAEPAEPEEGPLLSWIRPLRVAAIAYGSFNYNVNRPPGHAGVTMARSFDSDHDTFSPDLLELSLLRPLTGEGWEAGFRVDLAFGQTADRVGAAPWPTDDAVDLLQAYVEARAPVGGGVTFKGGKFVTWIGAEVIESPGNINISRSLVFTLLAPFTHTGLAVSYEAFPGLTYTQYLVNGWDNVIDDNRAKTLGGQLAWTHEELGVGVFLNWIHGDEVAGSVDSPRTVFDAVVSYGSDLVTAYVEVSYGREPMPIANGEWGGVAAAAQVTLAELVLIGARGEYVKDRNGTRTGYGRNIELRGLTATVGLKFGAWGLLRVEYRHDWASHAVFPDSRPGGAEVDQGTVAAELAFRY